MALDDTPMGYSMLKAQRRLQQQQSTTPQRRQSLNRRLSKNSLQLVDSASRRMSTPRRMQAIPIPLQESHTPKAPRPVPKENFQSDPNSMREILADPLGFAGVFGNDEDRLSLTPRRASSGESPSRPVPLRRDSIFGQPLRVKPSGTPRRSQKVATPARGITPASFLTQRMSSTSTKIEKKRLSTPRRVPRQQEPTEIRPTPTPLMDDEVDDAANGSTPLRSTNPTAPTKIVPISLEGPFPAPKRSAISPTQIQQLLQLEKEESALMKQLAALQQRRREILRAD